ncbi:hypothetical protein [Tepidiforma bonchosmolovskayae]|uniref:Uncharacterized protein n=1 Tax=Tepidiforma bonchosmolovskayae TaxID=2601677 RepID=A0ABX6C4M2_9CHLR|nr:hypothetical protein [Tepidiforma bonchosmolovskayae]QFG04214.1 hypothetical protein Tbon_13335 [Tepidiforma bonchosmolovskayae]
MYNLDPMSLAYLTRPHEPTPETRFREEYERGRAESRRQPEELINPERRNAARLLRERVIVNIGRFLARPS